jgi:hypothetical protein
MVLRRGPTSHVCTLGWDRDRDTFQTGQWFKGRIYEHKCDIAPDGRHWIYFAYKPDIARSATADSWTAVARVPYLRAIAFYPEGGTWGGCGRFLPDGCFTAHHNGDLYRLRDDESMETISELGSGYRDFSVPQVEAGWEAASSPPIPDPNGYVYHLDPVPTEKGFPGGWALQRTGWGSDAAYALVHWKHRIVAAFPEWQWADRDRDRLVWAEAGCLYTGNLGPEGLIDRMLLHDFNDMSFESLQAPY